MSVSCSYFYICLDLPPPLRRSATSRISRTTPAAPQPKASSDPYLYSWNALASRSNAPTRTAARTTNRRNQPTVTSLMDWADRTALLAVRTAGVLFRALSGPEAIRRWS